VIGNALAVSELISEQGGIGVQMQGGGEAEWGRREGGGPMGLKTGLSLKSKGGAGGGEGGGDGGEETEKEKDCSASMK
jgi:hypothetical protein